MTTWFERWGLTLLALVAAATGAAMSALVLVPHYQERIATMERDQARAIATARQADIDALKTANTHGNELTARLQRTESKLTHKDQELKNAIASKTTGRACLSGDVVRLLNPPAAEDRAAHLPTPTASPVATDGTAATDTAYASDRDIAQWVANARTQYDICRARLNALIDW